MVCADGRICRTHWPWTFVHFRANFHLQETTFLVVFGLLQILAQIFNFDKNMGYLRGDLTSGNGQSSEMACEKPPEYEDVIEPPRFLNCQKTIIYSFKILAMKKL